tara:strand:- start:1490 stop:1615 length:126 start_codon:yes stop_codon:yes gene_type:complete
VEAAALDEGVQLLLGAAEVMVLQEPRIPEAVVDVTAVVVQA